MAITDVQVNPLRVSWNAVDLGCTDGDIELTIDDRSVDITCHQHGPDVRDAIRLGVDIQLGLTIKETSVAQIKAIFAGSATLYTPGGGSEVMGLGDETAYTSMFADAKKLVLHPVANAAGDLTEDIAAWKAYPVIESWSFSGENPETITLNFRIFADETKLDQVNKLVFGDHTQSFV